MIIGLCGHYDGDEDEWDEIVPKVVNALIQ